MGLEVKDKDIVVPGQVLATGMDYLPSNGTYRKDDNILADRLGLLTVEGKVLKSIPLAGRYMPKRNDMIIGRVIDVMMSGWRLDTNSPYSAMLNLRDASYDYISKTADLTKIFDLDDYLFCKITQVTSQKLVDLTCKSQGLRKLRGGRIVKVNANKVPRIIGKKGSMVSMLKQALDLKIIVGQNGLVWMDGPAEDEIIAVDTIRKIENESHIPGLTEHIKEFLIARNKERGKVVEIKDLEDSDYLPRDEDERPHRDDRPRGDRPPRREGGYHNDRRGPPRGDRRGPPRGPPRGDRHDSRPPRRERSE